MAGAWQPAQTPAPVNQTPVQESRLRFTPEAPLAGASILVTYSPLGTLAGEQELVLRGHFRTVADRTYNGGLRNFQVARLERSTDDTFTASFILPDSAVYAAFAVEDGAGQRLDADGGKLYELLVHGEDGRPLYHSLIQRANDFAGRNWSTAYASNKLAMELHPDSLYGWSLLRFHEAIVLGSSGSDSLLPWHQENFATIHEQYADQSSLPPETVVQILGYAENVDDSVALEYWTERTRNEGIGTFKWAQMVGIEVVMQGSDDAEAALAAFEEYWPDAEDTGSQMLGFALQVASRAEDLTATERWVDRMLDGGGSKFSAARWLVRFPERRERAIELARDGLDRAGRAQADQGDLANHPGRPLGRTVGEYARTVASNWADRLITYSGILSAAGRESEALDALEEAAAEAVSPSVFQRLAEMKLSRGDTIGAARDYAVVATDPGTSMARADSLAALVALDSDSPEWRGLLDAAEVRILPRVLAYAVQWAPRPSRVSDANGNRLLLSDLIAGKTTVLVFWARNCGPCLQEIPELVHLRELMEPRGIQILSVTIDDLPGPDMDEFIATRSMSYPVYYDLNAEARNAFGVSAIPANFILDATGSVRFAFTHVSDIPRQLDALAKLEDDSSR